jgi:hypothetical protein
VAGKTPKLTEEEILKRVDVLTKLRANKGNFSKTSRETGIPRKTIAYWEAQNRKEAEKLRKEQAGDGTLAEDQQRVIAEGVDRTCKLAVEDLESLAAELVEEMRIAKGGAKFGELGIGFGIVFDKAQVMKGEPTSISKTIGNLSDEERAKRAAELIERGRQRRLNGGNQPMALVSTGTDGQGNDSTQQQ